MDKRIYKQILDINTEQVKKFWDDRSEKYTEDTPYVSVKLNDKNPEFAEIWDKYEKDKILPKLKIEKDSTVLDIGCGIGRLSEKIIGNAKYYLGVDFSEELIKIAKQRNTQEAEFDFKVMSFQELVGNCHEIKYIGKYDKIIIAGVFLYINEEDILQGLKELEQLLAPNCSIYISVPIAAVDRLTLREWNSDDFELEYNAIYRTIEQYKDIFSVLVNKGFKYSNEDYFLRDLNRFSETERYYFILER